MIINKLTLKMAVFVYIIITFLSCSVDEKDIENPSIDLSLVKHNNWTMSNDILSLINNYRLESGKSLLKKDTLYASAFAVEHSKYMIENNAVSHNNFFIRSNGLKSRGAVKVSENIAYAYTSAQSVVNAWLKSDSHREIINGDFAYIGFGIIKSLENKYYYTTLFYK